ncbi:MAG: glycoside hydrolase family 3 C-terminal domain-containing protein [Clostridia bacterium]|nr:glycoside hydrolase family 3 C-terminal domain-containing protein [Clostridia bacterium]
MDRKEARRQAEQLVARMTVEERASQLKYDAPAIPRLGVPAYNWWNEALHGVARAGTATVFPQAIGLAAVFDEDFHQRVAECIATEARAKYNAQSAHGDRDIYKGLTFWSPNINIFRDPRWGRGHETYGEDPVLTARLGVRFIRGLQGEGKYMKAAACAKHFAVHSGPEAIRHEFDAQATPKDMAETYLPAFEAAVKEARVEAVMGAYNRVNGEPACGSQTLLVDILRKKWGFEGHITSDCWAIADFHTHHHVTATAPESAAMALKAGCDLNCGVTYLHLLAALQEGLVTEEEITEAAVRLFTTRYLLGLFADDCEFDQIPYTACDTDANDALALEAAEKCMTLVKNNGLLPLDANGIRTLAVVGPNADSVEALIGNYHGTSSRPVTFLAGLRRYCEERGIRVLYSEGCAKAAEKLEGCALAPNDRLSEAVICAEQADAVIAVVGLDETLEGEEGDNGNYSASGDKIDLRLPASQRALLEALEKTGRPLVTVVAVGSALNVPQGDAQLIAWYPGQAGGTALARILFGEVSPSGKLPVTFYESVDDLPDFTDYSMKNRTYRYFTGTPLYPFGFGLSYSTFEVKDMAADGKAVTVTVRNTGKTDADNVVEVYVKALDSADAPLHPALAGFRRVSLKAGEEKAVTVEYVRNAFTVVNEAGERVPGGRRFAVYAGLSQPDPRSVALMGAAPLQAEVTLG